MMAGKNIGKWQWQQNKLNDNCYRQMASSEKRLYGFGADATKFPGGVKALANTIKSEFGVKYVCIYFPLSPSLCSFWW